MTDIAHTLVDKLPAVYLMFLLPVLLVVGIYVIQHIRRDKQGKLYWFSEKYEDRKRNKKQDVILDGLRDMRKDVLQLQVCAIDLPVVAKRTAYIAYKQLGYNGWMDSYVIEKGVFTKEDADYIKAQQECKSS